MSNATEAAAKAAFNRPDAFRGCVWEDPRDRDQTTEATREEYRKNALAGLLAALPHLTEGLEEVLDEALTGYSNDHAANGGMFVAYLAAAVSAHLEKAIKG